MQAWRAILNQRLAEEPAYMVPGGTIQISPFGQTLAGPLQEIHNIARAEQLSRKDDVDDPVSTQPVNV